MWIANLFRRASELTRLDMEVSRLRDDLDRERWRVKELESTITKERNAHLKDLRKHADAMSKIQGVKTLFIEPEPDIVPRSQAIETETEKEEIRWAAEQMRDADIENGYTPWDLSEYIKRIKENPGAAIM